MAIAKYNSLRAELYREPVDGSFDHITRAVLDELESDEDSDCHVDADKAEAKETETAGSSADV